MAEELAEVTEGRKSDATPILPGLGYDDPEEGKNAERAAVSVFGKVSNQALPIRAYLDQTVVPLLLQGLSALVKERWA